MSWGAAGDGDPPAAGRCANRGRRGILPPVSRKTPQDRFVADGEQRWLEAEIQERHGPELARADPFRRLLLKLRLRRQIAAERAEAERQEILWLEPPGPTDGPAG